MGGSITAETNRRRGLRDRVASALLLAVLTPWVGFGADRATREEALEAAYPGARFVAERVFLTKDEMRRASADAGEEIPSALIARYRVVRDGSPIGRAYVDTHIVRTKKESLLICLDGAGQVKRIEVTAFLEPPEYQASGPFYEQYKGRPLSPELQLNRAIRPIAGATLTVRATNQAVRRVLAIDRALQARNLGAKP